MPVPTCLDTSAGQWKKVFSSTTRLSSPESESESWLAWVWLFESEVADPSAADADAAATPTPWAGCGGFQTREESTIRRVPDPQRTPLWRALWVYRRVVGRSFSCRNISLGAVSWKPDDCIKLIHALPVSRVIFLTAHLPRPPPSFPKLVGALSKSRRIVRKAW